MIQPLDATRTVGTGMPGRVRRLAGLAAGVCAAAIIGALVAVSPAAAAALAVLILLVPLAVAKPAECTMALLGWGVLRYPLTRTFGLPATPISAVELVVAVVLLVIALRRGSAGRWILGLHRAWFFLTCFVVAAALSAVVNRSGIVPLLFGVRGYLLVPMLALCATMLIDEDRDRMRLRRLGFALTLIQVPVATVQYWFLGGRETDVNIVVGTLGTGGANVLGVWMLVAIVWALIEYFKRPRWTILLACSGFLAVMVWSSARLALWLLPAAVLVAVFAARGGTHSLPSRLVGGVAVVGVFGLIVVSAYAGGRTDLGRDLDLQRLVEAQSQVLQAGRVPRLGYITYGLQYGAAHSAFMPLGTGPASAASGAAVSVGGAGSVAYLTGLRLIASGSVSRLSNQVRYSLPLPPQLPSTLVEYGVVGLIAYMGFIVMVGLAVWRRLRVSPAPLVPMPVFVMIALLMTVGTLYAVVWESFSLVGLAFWWAVILSGEPGTSRSTFSAGGGDGDE